MEVKSVTITNILGIESLTIEPGAVTILYGRNGVGKSSVIAAVKDVLSGGHDPSLIRNGAASGEVAILLSDGVVITKTIKPEKSTLVVRHPSLGKVSKSQAYIDKIVDSLSLDPIRFLSAPAKERVKLLLEALPLKVTAGQLDFLPVDVVRMVDLNLHALEALGALHKLIYDARRDKNAIAKDKAATAAQLAESLPPDSDQDWVAIHSERVAEKASLQKEANSRLAGIRSDLAAVKESAKANADAQKAANHAAIQKQIDELREQLRLLDEATFAAQMKTVDEAEGHAEEAEKALRAEFEPRYAELTAAVQEAATRKEDAIRADQTRKNIAQFRHDAGIAEQLSEVMTSQLEQLDALKADLLKALPIPGLEIADGQVLVGGIPFDRVNDAEKYRIAIEIGKLRSGDLPLLVVDRAEIFDASNWAEFQKAAKASGVQIIAARVTEGDLSVQTGGAE